MRHFNKTISALAFLIAISFAINAEDFQKYAGSKFLVDTKIGWVFPIDIFGVPGKALFPFHFVTGGSFGSSLKLTITFQIVFI